MQQFLQDKYFSNTVSDYLLFLTSITASFIFIKVSSYFFLKHLDSWAEKTEMPIDDLLVRGIRKYLIPIIYFIAFYLSTKILNISDTPAHILNMAIIAFVTVIGALFASSVSIFLFGKYLESKMQDANNKSALKWMSGIIKILIWSIALLLFLDNTGVKINSLITGLGIGGIAIAFAAQTVLTDIFCFFTIFFDRPFEVGDFIVAGDQMGTVEYIGLKTTRLRALGGEQLVFSNRDLTSSRISNYKTMEQRRVLFTIGVTYDTAYEKLKEIPELIKSIIVNVPDTTFGRTHFCSYGDYSLNFEIVYYILSGDYDQYMDIHQEVNFRIKEEFDKRKIEFAFPTQTLQLFSIGSSSDIRNS